MIANSSSGNASPTSDLDFAIVGGGFTGLHMLYRATRAGRKVRLFEAGTGVGGTWYWNRYPGARVDVESLEYSYSFSEELQQEWNWTERYSAQPELLKYANHVADRFDLRPHIQLNTKIVSAIFDEASNRWTLTTAQGEKVRARFCILATGLLVVPNKPKIPDLDSYAGVQVLTSHWPKDGIELSGKRVCVIGTGSSGIQCIPEIAKVASHLTVLQRTPSYCIPARNRALDPDYQRAIKARYPELRKKEEAALAGFISLDFIDDPYPTKNAMEVSAEERRAEYDRRWAAGGLSFYYAFKDLLFDPTANATLAEYVDQKIRERVRDPKTAEKLIPKSFPILSKRLCADNGYYEAYNRDNVTLVDLHEAPIQRAVPEGLVVGDQTMPFDVIVFATGFDALTGSIAHIDVRGRGGRTIRQHWSDGLKTYAGLMASGFPNLFFMNGPGAPSAFNAPIRIAEYQADYIMRCAEFMDARHVASIEVSSRSEIEWMAAVNTLAAPTLFMKTSSWYLGDNVPGKPRQMLVYLGGYQAYRDECEKAAANGYQGFIISPQAEPAA